LVTTANEAPPASIELVHETGEPEMYIVFDGRRIAKRGKPGTQYHKQWIALEPGVAVRAILDKRRRNKGIEVEINGEPVRVH
jgi:hypothetical protein